MFNHMRRNNLRIIEIPEEKRKGVNGWKMNNKKFPHSQEGDKCTSRRAKECQAKSLQIENVTTHCIQSDKKREARTHRQGKQLRSHFSTDTIRR